MDNLLQNLNKEQTQAVTHKGAPLLIVAGAGTGKTTVITRRIAYLVEQKLAKPDEILALTFTEKAAAEMQERADLLLPLGYYDMWISTFHSFGERILKARGLDIGLPNDFTLLDETSQWVLLYKNIDKFNLDYYRPRGNPSKFIDALLSHFSRCKDELISPGQYLEYAQSSRLTTDSPEKTKKQSRKDAKVSVSADEHHDLSEISRLEELANTFHQYQKLLVDNNFLDFGDLINYTLELFQKRPKILEFYRQKFKYILVDEFQDTNYAQYQLVKLLTADGNNLTVVGDDDQSIYKFRGASVSNIMKFKDDFPKLKQITLIENYRSAQNILDLAYNFIQGNNPDRLEVKLKINKRLKSNAGPRPSLAPQGTIEVLEGADLSEELNLVAKKILELKDNQTSWNDFAILMRRNASAGELLPILSARGIPHTFLANRGLYKKPIIVDLLSYLRLLKNCHDSASLYRVLNFPKFSILHHELAVLTSYAHKKALSLYDTLKVSGAMPGIGGESKTRLKKVLETIDRHSALAKTATAAEIFVRTVRDLGVEELVRRDTLENAENRELIEQFYKKIEAFEQREQQRGLYDYLAALDLELQAGNEGSIKIDSNLGPESLKVMTVHSAKGLEFKYVFVISLVEQRFPTREKSESIEIPDALVKEILPEGDFHLQEERRLFYVAMTRAKTHLYLSWAKDYGGARAKRPSQFLTEAGLVPGGQISQATGQVVFGKLEKKLPLVYSPPAQFSYSQLTDYQTCPLKYKYQHYLKLPVAGSCYLSFGQTMHKVFEQYLTAYKARAGLPAQDLFGENSRAQLPDEKFLESLYHKNWVDDWYKSAAEKEQYRALGETLLKTFYEELAKNQFKPKYIEKSFRLKLGNFVFTGKIDRADEDGSGIVILDYKTGKSPEASSKKKDLDQLYIYQWAAEEYLREEVTGLKYWFLQDNRIVAEAVADGKEIEQLRGRLLKLMEEISYVTQHDLFSREHGKARDHNCEFEFLG